MPPAAKRRHAKAPARSGPTLPPLPSAEAPPDIQRMDILDSAGRTLRAARVARGEWRDPEDAEALSRDADGRAGQRMVRGFRVVDPIEHLHARNPSEITLRHVRAARRLRDIYEAAHGAQGGRDPNRTAAAPTQLPVEFQMDAIRRLRGVIQAVGPSLWGVLCPVAVHGWTVSRLAEARGSSAHRMTGYLVAALDRLADHFWPDREVATIVPARIDPEVVPDATGLPPERIGRWRAQA